MAVLKLRLGTAEDQLQLCEQSNEEPTKKYPVWGSKRLLVAILLFFGYFMYSMLCQNICIALVEMTTSKLATKGNKTIVIPPEFNWDLRNIGVILNMFWYGFTFSTLGGFLSQKFGGALVLGISTLVSSIITVLNPSSIYCHYNLLLASRGLLGFFESCSSASNAEIFARWIPQKERSAFMSSVINGMYVGTATSYPFCGYLAHKWGWPMIFYVTGILGIIWSLLWLIVVRNSPTEDGCISEEELAYILEGTGRNLKKGVTTPYKDIFLSPPFWALSIGKFAFNWGSAFTVAYLPLFIKEVTRLNINEVGLLSFIPNISIFIVPIAGLLMSYWQNHTNLTITQIQKSIIASGYIFSCVLFLVIAFAHNFTTSILSLFVIKLILSLNKVILEMITVSMAPNHSGLLSGLSLFGQTLGIVASQTIAGLLIKNHNVEEWNKCFLLSAAVMAFSGIIIAFFGSSDPQPWSLPKPIKPDRKISQNELPLK